MEPALAVAACWLLFAGTHIGLAAGRLRAALHARLGEWGFMILFSLVAAGAFVLLIRTYATLRWAGAPGLALGAAPMVRGALIAGVVAGVVLTTASLVVYPRSPMALFGESVRTPHGLERVTRHSFFVGVALLATAHALLATRLVGTVFFAALALFVTVGAWHQDRKLLRLRGAPYAEYLAATSTLPFAAVLAGRQRIVWRELPVGALLAGLAAAVLLRTVHASIFSHAGAWVIGATLGGAALEALQAWRREQRRRARTGPDGPSEASDFGRRALACCGATLLAYVGLIHETVGATLYPDGPAMFGGPLGWHAAGLSLTAFGLLILAGTLGLPHVPVIPLAAVAGTAGGIVAVGEALVHGGFHLFAVTTAVAAAMVIVNARTGQKGHRRADRPPLAAAVAGGSPRGLV